MKKGVTIKDIAQKLNMSISTVSKALHKDSSISTLTKERVEKQADEWNYVPNEAARHFKLNKNFYSWSYYSDLLDQFLYWQLMEWKRLLSGKNIILSFTIT